MRETESIMSVLPSLPSGDRPETVLTVSSIFVAAGVLFLFSLFQFFPVFFSLPHSGAWDWNKEFFFCEIQRLTVTGYGQFPLWNPFAYGGVAGMAHPESTWLGPSFWLLIIPFGSVLGLKLKVFAGLWFGAVGTWCMARSQGLSKTGAHAVAVIMMLSGYFALHAWIGHSMWSAVSLFPWLLLAVFSCRTCLQSVALGALAVALMLFEGAPYILLFSFLFLAVLSIVEAVRSRNIRILRRVFFVFALGLMLSGIKLLPTLQFMNEHPRTHVQRHEQGANDLPMSGVDLVWNGLLFADYSDVLPFEDGAYLGLLPLMLVGVGLVVSIGFKWPWYLTGALFLVIAMGDDGVPGLWSFFRGLPVIKQTIFPQRYLFGALFPIALAAGFGLDWLRLRMGRVGNVAAFAILAAIVVDYTARNHPVYVSMFDSEMLETNIYEGPIRGQLRMPSEYHSYGGLVEGFGVINAHPYIPHPEPAVVDFRDPRYRGEYFAVEGAEVDLIFWTPNDFGLEVGLRGRPDRVVVNQNYSDGWVVRSGDAVVCSDSGRLAVDVNSSGRVELRYLPPRMRLGMLVSVVGVLLMCGLAIRHRFFPTKSPGSAKSRMMAG